MTIGRSNLVDIACEVRAETASAVQIFDGTKLVWLPKSQIEGSLTTTGMGYEIAMPEWLALEKGLI